MTLFRDNFRGLNGFEELRKYIKQGSEFCKEVATIIQERSDLESHYAKNLQKLSAKLIKAASNNIGTLAEGWKAVAVTMEQEAELHKNLSAALVDEISKPLKQVVEAQTKARRPIEVQVDKSLKSLTDKRTDEYKAKKVAHQCAKDFEKGEDSRQDAKSGNKKCSDKEINKLDKKCDQFGRSLKKADKEYCETCEKAEAARQEWDLNVCKGSSQLQNLEEERISKMSEYLNQYNSHMSVMGPKITQSCDRLNESVIAVDLQSDLNTIVQQKGTGPVTSEQILIDCCAEDMQFSMKPERRKNSLQNYLLFIRQSIERERKGREGVEKLIEVYNQRPGFADPQTQEDTKQRLLQVKYTMNFLEASHFKLANSFAKLDGQPKLEHKFAQYIESTRDKQGMQVSTLRLPINLASEGNSGYDVTSVTLSTLANQDSNDVFARRRFPADYISTPFFVDSTNRGPHVRPSRPTRCQSYLRSSSPDLLAMSDSGKSSPPARPPRPKPYLLSKYASSPDLLDLREDEVKADYPNSSDDEFETESIGRCRVIFNYDGQHADELTIHEGDIINLYEKQEDGWWQGECGGSVGIFPATYVEEL